MRRGHWILGSLIAALSIKLAQGAGNVTIHTVFTAECDSYFNWQTIGLYHSFQKSGHSGPITRLLSCSDENIPLYKDIDVDVPTHFAPSWTIHPKTGDMYSGINKPVAVRDWLQKVKPPEDIILIIDDDTIMRRPLDPVALGVKPGWAVAGFYGYMKGVANALAEKHVPNVLPRNDSIAGPRNRRGDQVGGFSIMYKDDLARMADDWVSVTEDVRADPDAWNTSGDVYTPHKGDKPWIAEMYGYSFGASKSDIWHNTNNEIMLYPGYDSLVIRESLPAVLHYGIKFYINHKGGKWEFDKHWYRTFDPLKCPPWTERDVIGRPLSGIFDPPPHPNNLTAEGHGRWRDLLSMETIATINEGLCERHLAKCPATPQLLETCKKVMDLSKAVQDAQKAMQKDVTPLPLECKDELTDCKAWAALGECEKNSDFMGLRCPKSCGKCTFDSPNEEPSLQKGQSAISDKASANQTDLILGTGLAVQKQKEGHVVVKTDGDAVTKSTSKDLEDKISGGDQTRDTGALHTDAMVHMNPDEKQQLERGQHAMANPDEKQAAEKNLTVVEHAIEVQNRAQAFEKAALEAENLAGGLTETPVPVEKKPKADAAIKQTEDQGNVTETPVALDQHEVAGASLQNTQTTEKLVSSDSKQIHAEALARNITADATGGSKPKNETLGSTVDLVADPNCLDEDKLCLLWAQQGECEKNVNYMLQKCRKSCNVCLTLSATQEELAAMQDAQQRTADRLARAQRVAAFKTRCFQATHWTMTEVKECLTRAEKDQEYDRPPTFAETFKTLELKKNVVKMPELTEEILASKVGAAKTVKLKKKSRKLVEKPGMREQAEDQFNLRNIFLLGLGVAVSVLLVRMVIPALHLRSSARQKNGRQD